MAVNFDIDHIAHLARLAFTDEQKQLLGQQLSSILAYVDKIGSIDVTGVEPTLHGQPVSNAFREDIPVKGLNTEDVLKNAPARIDDEIKMPRIVE